MAINFDVSSVHLMYKTENDDEYVDLGRISDLGNNSIELNNEQKENQNEFNFGFLEPMECTIKFKYGKHLRCKSRKRFIKLLMSKGVQRNIANKVALFVRVIRYESYDIAWRTYYFTGGV